MACAAAAAESVCSMTGIFTAGLQRAATTTISGARNALSRSRCSVSSSACGVRAPQVIGEQLAEARARLAAHDDEAPGAQAPVVGSARGAGKNESERSLIGGRIGERRGGAARQERVYGLHRGIVADSPGADAVRSLRAQQGADSRGAHGGIRRQPPRARDRQRHRAARGAFRDAPAASRVAAERAAREPAAARRSASRSRVRPNLLAPLALDVRADPWDIAPADAVFSANTLHIMSWGEVGHFFRGAGQLLGQPGVLCVYGPFRYGGRHTSDSNAEFDAYLKARDPAQRHPRLRGARNARARRRASSSPPTTRCRPTTARWYGGGSGAATGVECAPWTPTRCARFATPSAPSRITPGRE